jgi:hypothetical protein
MLIFTLMAELAILFWWAIICFSLTGLLIALGQLSLGIFYLIIDRAIVVINHFIVLNNFKKFLILFSSLFIVSALEETNNILGSFGIFIFFIFVMLAFVKEKLELNKEYDCDSNYSGDYE